MARAVSARAARKHRAAARPRRYAARPAVKRKATSAKPARTKPARTKSAGKHSIRKARVPQTFIVSHHREQDFEAGLRSYAKYRDLGMSAATGGMVQAHVIRLVPPFKPGEVSKRHYHDVEFQMVYVLKGWYESEFEGQGTIRMHAGSAWIQPPRIKHTTLGYSDDCELLEIVLPADFKTVMLE